MAVLCTVKYQPSTFYDQDDLAAKLQLCKQQSAVYKNLVTVRCPGDWGRVEPSQLQPSSVQSNKSNLGPTRTNPKEVESDSTTKRNGYRGKWNQYPHFLAPAQDQTNSTSDRNNTERSRGETRSHPYPSRSKASTSVHQYRVAATKRHPELSVSSTYQQATGVSRGGGSNEYRFVPVSTHELPSMYNSHHRASETLDSTVQWTWVDTDDTKARSLNDSDLEQLIKATFERLQWIEEGTTNNVRSQRCRELADTLLQLAECCDHRSNLRIVDTATEGTNQDVKSCRLKRLWISILGPSIIRRRLMKYPKQERRVIPTPPIPLIQCENTPFICRRASAKSDRTIVRPSDLHQKRWRNCQGKIRDPVQPICYINQQ